MPFDDDSDARLKWAAFVGTQPEGVRQWLSDYPGTTCYRTTAGGAEIHVWIQGYQYLAPALVKEGEAPIIVDVLQGKDSLHPGLTLKMIPLQRLKRCDCRRYIVPTKEEGEASMKKIEAAMKQLKADLDYRRLMASKTFLN